MKLIQLSKSLSPRFLPRSPRPEHHPVPFAPHSLPFPSHSPRGTDLDGQDEGRVRRDLSRSPCIAFREGRETGCSPGGTGSPRRETGRRRLPSSCALHVLHHSPRGTPREWQGMRQSPLSSHLYEWGIRFGFGGKPLETGPARLTAASSRPIVCTSKRSVESPWDSGSAVRLFENLRQAGRRFGGRLPCHCTPGTVVGWRARGQRSDQRLKVTG